MSEFDDMLSEMHADLFGEFGDPVEATVTRGTAAPVPVTIILDKESRQVGEFGTAVAIVSLVSFRNAEWQPRPEDVVTVAGQSRRIASIDADDGYVTVGVLHG